MATRSTDISIADCDLSKVVGGGDRGRRAGQTLGGAFGFVEQAARGPVLNYLDGAQAAFYCLRDRGLKDGLAEGAVMVATSPLLLPVANAIGRAEDGGRIGDWLTGGK